ncbi:hypothetical protein IAR50_005285 [Cryptococcus sp. DSM 104548]
MAISPIDTFLSFSNPSFHPVLSIAYSLPLPSQNCTSAASFSLTLPDALFVDPDELSGKWPMVSGHNESRANWDWALDPPVSVDIERPSFGGSVGLHTLHVRLNPSTEGKEQEALDVPLHARYLAPNEQGVTSLMFPGEDGSELRAGWVCAESLPDIESIETVDLPIVHPVPASLTLPTGKHAHQELVELATPVVIWLGWAWIMWKLWGLSRRSTKVKTL